MSTSKILDFDDYDNYPSEANPTTDDQMQDYMRNQNDILKAMSNMLWQPGVNVVAGQVIYSPNMKTNTLAVVTTAGQTGNAEPAWGAVNSVIQDGGVIYKIKQWTGDYLPLTGGEVTGNISIKNTGADIDVAPTERKESSFYFRDKNNNTVGGVSAKFGTDGSHEVIVQAKKSSTEDSYNILAVGWDKDGKPYVKARTPDIDDDSISVATTAFVKAVLEKQNTSDTTNGMFYFKGASIKSKAGCFFFDSNSGILATELPSALGSADWVGIQIAMLNGADKTQFIFNKATIYARSDDNALGAETWTQASWQDMVKKTLNYKTTVTVSTQAYRTVKETNGIAFNTNDSTKTTGSGEFIRYYREFRTNTGIAAGTYTLQALLQALVQKSHTHTTYQEAQKYNCNCNCGDSDTDS